MMADNNLVRHLDACETMGKSATKGAIVASFACQKKN
jgi:hypothetical protein